MAVHIRDGVVRPTHSVAEVRLPNILVSRLAAIPACESSSVRLICSWASTPPLGGRGSRLQSWIGLVAQSLHLKLGAPVVSAILCLMDGRALQEVNDERYDLCTLRKQGYAVDSRPQWRLDVGFDNALQILSRPLGAIHAGESSGHAHFPALLLVPQG